MKKKLFIALALALSVFAVHLSPAGAVVPANQTQPWHAGRGLYDNFGTGAACTTGIHAKNPQGYYFFIIAMHCLNGAFFMSRYENNAWTDWYNWNSVYAPVTAYSQYDLAAIELGTTAPAKSQYVFDYCNPAQSWNCSSHLGGGTANNPNWAGHWRRYAGYNTGNPANISGVCKAGAYSGTSCGNTGSAAILQPNGYQWQLSNLNNCGSTGGDSSGPVYSPSGNDYAYLQGMLTGAAGGSATAGPGNSCYANGTQYNTNVRFYAWNTIASVFVFNLGALTPVTSVTP